MDYPVVVLGLHPYEGRVCKYFFKGVWKAGVVTPFALYNSEDGHSVSLDTILKVSSVDSLDKLIEKFGVDKE